MPITLRKFDAGGCWGFSILKLTQARGIFKKEDSRFNGTITIELDTGVISVSNKKPLAAMVPLTHFDPQNPRTQFNQTQMGLDDALETIDIAVSWWVHDMKSSSGSAESKTLFLSKYFLKYREIKLFLDSFVRREWES